MSDNWFTNLVRTCFGTKTPSAQTRKKLGLKKLEDRRLLNADFTLMGGTELILSNFGGDVTQLQITQGTADLDPDAMGTNNEDVYFFNLDGETWNNLGGLADDQFEILSGGSDDRILAVAVDAFTSLSINDTSGGVDVAVVFGGDDSGTNRDGDTLILTSPEGIQNVTVTDVGTITHAGQTKITELDVVNAESVTFSGRVQMDLDAFSATTRAHVDVIDTDFGDLETPGIEMTGIKTDIDHGFAASTDGDGDITIRTNRGIRVTGTVEAVDDMDVPQNEVRLLSAGDITLEGEVTGSTVALVGNGNITQNDMGVITANGLLVEQNDDGGPFNVDLCADNVVDTFAGVNYSEEGAINFHSTQDLTIGDVYYFGDIGVTGVTTYDGTIGLHSDGDLTVVDLQNAFLVNSNGGSLAFIAGGSFDIPQEFVLGMDREIYIEVGEDLDVDYYLEAGTVRLVANGEITQSSLITATNLGVRQESTDPDLDITLIGDNAVTNFAAFNASSQGMVTFKSINDLTISTVATGVGKFSEFETTTGIQTTNGDVTLLVNNGEYETLTIDSPIVAGSGVVRMIANGEISQSETGLISASAVGVRQIHSGTDDVDIQLCEDNVVGVFAAENMSSGGQVTFRSVIDLTVGAVTGKMVSMDETSVDFAATSGVRTANGNIGLESAMDLTITHIIQPGNGPDGDIVLDSGATLEINVALVTAGDVLLDAENDLELTQTINADNVRIKGAGDITQTMTGIITAYGLGVIATGGDVTLCEDNMVTTFAASNTHAGGEIDFYSDRGLTITDVDAQAFTKNVQFGALSGVTSNSGDIVVASASYLENYSVVDSNGGDILLHGDSSVFLGARVESNAGTVRLLANDFIGQSESGIVVGEALGVRLEASYSGNHLTLFADNRVNQFAAFNASDGGMITYNNATALTIATVSAGTGKAAAFATTTGVQTTSVDQSTNDITIRVTGQNAMGDSLLVNQVISVGDSNDLADVRLVANGSIRQDSVGVITANELGVRQVNTGDDFVIFLCEENVVDLFAAENLSNSSFTGANPEAFISFHSVEDLTTGTVGEKIIGDEQSLFVFESLTGITTDANDMTNGGKIELQSDQNLVFPDMSLINSHGGSLAFIAGNTFDLNTSISIPNSDLYINVGTGFKVEHALTADTIRIVADGAISQSETGILTANTLGVRQESTVVDDVDVLLTLSTNAVHEFAAFNASIGGEIAFNTSESLTVVTVGPGAQKFGTFLETNGVVSSGTSQNVGNNITLQATDGDAFTVESLTIDAQVNSGLADTRLIAHGDILQDSGVITANQLGVRQELIFNEDEGATYDIELVGNNEVDEFAADNAYEDGMISFRSTRDLTIGSVGPWTVISECNDDTINFADTRGVTSTSGVLGGNDITLASEASLSVEQEVSVGDEFDEADVRLIARGNISQTASGVITAQQLGVQQIDDVLNVNIELCEDNVVNEFSALNQSVGGFIGFHSITDLTINSIAAKQLSTLTPTLTFTQVDGVTSIDGDIEVTTSLGRTLTVDSGVRSNSGNVYLGSGSSLELNDQILAGSGTVRLLANGGISQSSPGTIVAQNLGVRQVSATTETDVELGFENAVGEFAAWNDSDGGMIIFRNSTSLAIGDVAAGTGLKSSDFDSTVGVTSTLTSGAQANRDDDVDGILEVDDTINGDILIDVSGSLVINEAIHAGIGGSSDGSADIRLTTTGGISQTGNGILIANELGVDQTSGTSNLDIELTLENRVDEISMENESSEGAIRFNNFNDGGLGNTADQLNVNFVSDLETEQNAQFSRVNGIRANGGEIVIEAGGNLNVVGFTDPMLGNSFRRDIVSSQSVDGERIVLRAVDGNISLGANVNISTDGNLAAGTSVDTTNDSLLIEADSNNDSVDSALDGSFIVSEGVVLRTDGGVATTFGPRPHADNAAFFNDLIREFNFETLPVPNFFLTSFSLMIGAGDPDGPGGPLVAEENLRISIRWNDPQNDATGDLDEAANTLNNQRNSRDFFNEVTSDADIVPSPDPTSNEFMLVPMGGEIHEFGHIYSQFDVNSFILGDNTNEVPADFGVSHHESIVVNGRSVQQNDVGPIDVGELPEVPDPVDPRENLGNLSRTGDDVNFNSDRFQNGRIVFQIPVPARVFVAAEPEPPPTALAPQPAFEPIEVEEVLAASPLIPSYPSRTSVSTQSFDFFELRREGVDEPIIDFISEDQGDSLLDPDQLREFIREKGIGDEVGYELWLITSKQKNGEPIRIERIILKFDIIDEEPIPAVDALEGEFPALRLVPVDSEGNAIDEQPVELEAQDGAIEELDPSVIGPDDQEEPPMESEEMALSEPGTESATRTQRSRETNELDEKSGSVISPLTSSVTATLVVTAANRRASSDSTNPGTERAAGSRLLNRLFSKRHRS
ncbi:hypothetical protein KOR42_40150 [Thalassoglobus neptunius]|uniref:Uncharacterized protein n=1 Tax=Thalassoglobus neptunius TaxID=1938619 RepID=A0A5C5WC43_9PLAN|nr:hypothetical protein [Thalassoglobus neptunius]TWT48224.1 hypothetical protein KOR42_40150 [Thalassoglobus neptunius]